MYFSPPRRRSGARTGRSGPGSLLHHVTDGSAAVVLRGNSLFCATPQLPRELLRLAARQAGVRLYTDDECVLYSDGVNVLVHATHEGPVTLRLPQAAMVFDALNGQALTSTAQATLRLELRFGETRIVRLQP